MSTHRATALAACLMLSAPACKQRQDQPAIPQTAGPVSAQICSNGVRALRGALVRIGRGVVVTPVEDLLDRPEPQSSLGDQALLGDVVHVLPGAAETCTSPRDHWVEVETAAGYRAWIGVTSVWPLASGESPYRESGPLVRITARFGSLYVNPTVTEHKPLLIIPWGGLLRSVRTVDERWLEVALPGSQHGYIQSGDVTPEKPAEPSTRPTAACVIEHARGYLGTPYLWGGRSTLGIDCSGLVSNAFIACGLVPPRDAGPQFKWEKGRAVPQDEKQLRPADLLFFGEHREGAAPKVTHVGIHLGGGRFIHATTHDHPVVQESLISEPHWTQEWVGVRRYLPEESAAN